MHKVLIYTLEEGGELKMLADFVDERGYLEIKRRGWFDVQFGAYPERIYPAYIAFAVIANDHDFVLERMGTTDYV
jgi:hypothetical protein